MFFFFRFTTQEWNDFNREVDLDVLNDSLFNSYMSDLEREPSPNNATPNENHDITWVIYIYEYIIKSQ